MKKQFNRKIIIVAIIFALFLSQSFLPYQSQAAGINLNWENPSAGKNPYKFNISTVLNSDTMMAVVGCTGIVNKVSEKIMSMFQGDTMGEVLDNMAGELLEEVCFAVNSGIQAALTIVPNLDISDIPDNIVDLCKTEKALDKESVEAAEKQLKTLQQNKLREECLNGVAIALAKRQLVSMTKSTMNWVTSGFNGDPMYVQNINRYMDNITNRIINEEIELFKGADPYYYPYGRSYARSLISSNNFKNDVFGSLKLTLGDYLDFDYGYSDNYDYGYSDDYNYGIVERYANDFESGGWDGWLAFTQFDQNNPIGFNIMASDETQRKENEKTEEAEKEMDMGDGMLSQKICKVTDLTQADANRKANKERADKNLADALAKYQNAQTAYNKNPTEEEKIKLDMAKSLYNQAQKVVTALGSDGKYEEECKEWEIVTPGKIIGETVTEYLNSPIRQLELADTINEALSILFDSLLKKFKKEGLTSIGYNTGNDFSNVSEDFASNATFDTNGNRITTSQTSSGGWNKPFDLKTDLGNTYIRDALRKLGTWDANENRILGTYDAEEKFTPSSVDENEKLSIGIGEINTYYEVTVKGDTKLIPGGYNHWEVGDRAFFDGDNWQNWKKPTPGKPDLPILKRGVLQVQQDYIVAAKNLLSVLPNVMPKIGELDYCIPGPNPEWESYLSDSFAAFSDYASGLRTVYEKGGFLVRDSVTIEAPDRTSLVYRTFMNLFTGTNLWDNVITTAPWKSIQYATYRGYGGGDLDWEGKNGIAAANNLVNNMKNKTFLILEQFIKDYRDVFNNNYGDKSLMQTEFLRKENVVSLINNPAYLPVASIGLNITKNIQFYDDEVKEDYESNKNAIVEAESNIAKLSTIKARVSSIINDAQERRDDKRNEIINKIMEVNEVNRAEAEKIYTSCSEQEKIIYFDASDLLIDIGQEKIRCSDKLDNDLDGYTDMYDFDCNKTGNIDIGRRSLVLPPGEIPNYTSLDDTNNSTNNNNDSETEQDYVETETIE